MRAVRLNFDTTYEVFDLGPYPHLNQQINPNEAEAPFDLMFLNGPTHLHPEHIAVGIATDANAGERQLPFNNLASSLSGVFNVRAEPVVGTAVVVGSTWLGEATSVPHWTLDLIREIKHSVDIAFKYHQSVGNN